MKALLTVADEIIERMATELDYLSGARVLITGASGFLGTHFVHTLLRLNDQKVLKTPLHVTAMDNQLLGEGTWHYKPEDRKDLTFLTQSVCDPFDWSSWTHIIHAASIASPTFYRRFPIETIDANVLGLRRLLDLAVAYSPRSVLFFSTSEIYGDPDPSQIPIREDYWGNVNCTGPRACYDESKRLGETMCLAFHQVHQVPVKIARPFNNYGPGMKIGDRRVIPDFCQNILHGEDLRIYSDGHSRRTFCFISDAMTGYLKLLGSNHNGVPINIGNDQPEISVRELAGLMIKTTSSDLRTSFALSDDEHYVTDNPKRRCPDISRARELLGYEPRVGLEEGLLRTYQSFTEDRP